MRHKFQFAADAIKLAEERTGEKFDLLPCAHCGHHANLVDPEKDPNSWGGYQWAIICSSSHCRSMMTIVADGYFEQVDMALNPGHLHNGYSDRVTNLRARWNRRSLRAHESRERGFVKPDNDRQIFFYEQDFYVLSNFSSFRVRYRGHDFDTSEHAYHWAKFLNVSDEADIVCALIKNARSAHAAFKIAEANKHLMRGDWNHRRVGIMRDILRSKADQHEYVRRKLLATGERELIEDSWRDDFWGWGPNRDGKNMLGHLWMDIRAELRAGELP